MFVTLSLLTVSFAQSAAPPKRKKIKDFGSSLKRLKWNPEKNTAVELSGPGTNSDEDDVIRIDTSLVSTDLLVIDQHGKSVAGLTAEDFSIAEDDVPQTLGHFFNGDNISVPRTIVLIIDYSGSQRPYLKNSVKAAKVLVDKLGPKDLMAIVTDDVELLQEFTSDKKKLKSKVDSLVERTRWDSVFFGAIGGPPRMGRSKQYSALMATLNEAFDEEDVRPIIIFQTDGDEAYYLRNPPIRRVLPEGLEGEALAFAQNMIGGYPQALTSEGLEFSLDDLYRAVERSRATLYTVVPGIKLLGLTPEEQRDKLRVDWENWRAKVSERLRKQMQHAELAFRSFAAVETPKLQAILASVAPLSGGWTEFLERPEQADEIYSRIFSDINQRYIVGYYPTNKERDGKRRKIDFAVKGHPEYQVYGRRSYFAPGP